MNLSERLADLAGNPSPEGLKQAAMTIEADAEDWKEKDWNDLWHKWEQVHKQLLWWADVRKDVVYNEDFDWWNKGHKRLLLMEAYLWEQILSQV